ncbi:hypothetical protein EON79_00625 [bacterium]|nr:MAG: hypothetical protein EON79_00625 [bacterium]
MLLPTLLAEPTLDVAPGYYTLADLVRVASRSGIPVRVDPECGNDSYAAAITRLPWPAIVQALRADHTLDIAEEDGRWTIRRNAATVKREAEEAKRYLAQLSEAYATPYRMARAKVDPVYLLPPDEWEKKGMAFKSPAGASALDTFVAGLAMSNFLSNDMYAQITIPIRTAPLIAQGPEAPPVTGPLWSLMNWLMPKNPIKEWEKWFFLQAPAGESPEDEAKRKEILSSLQADLEWHLDPQSGGASYMLGMTMRFQTRKGRLYANPSREAILNKPLFGPAYLPALDLQKIVGEERYETLQARQIESEAALNGAFPKGQEEVAFPEGSFADTLLRVADRTKSNVIFRPPSFFNVRLAKRTYPSLAEGLKAGTTPQAVRKDALRHLTSRIGTDEFQRVPGLALDPHLVFRRVGTILTVQDDLRFLERFANSRPIFSEATANDGLKEKTVPAAQILAEIAAMRPESWRKGAPACAALDFGDPTELYAYARLYKTSAAFRAELAALKTKPAIHFPMANLTESDRQSFARSLFAIEKVYVKRDAHSSPSSGGAYVLNLDLESLAIRVTKQEKPDGWEYHFETLRDGEFAWAATLRRVTPLEASTH